MRAKETIPVMVVFALLVSIIEVPQCTPAQADADLSQIFSRSDVMIQMRDGVHLRTEFCVPKNAAGPLPFLITRTPYGINDDAQGFSRTLNNYRELIPEGYIFVFQDIRGRFQSEGQFVMLRPPRDRSRSQSHRREHRHLRHHRLAAQERARQQRPRRHAGHLLRRLADRDGHARSAPRAQGRFRAGFAGRHVPGRRLPSQRRFPPELRLRVRLGHDGDLEDATTSFHSTRWTPSSGTCAWARSRNVNERYFHGKMPTWNDFVAHPNYDEFWQTAGVRALSASESPCPT